MSREEYSDQRDERQRYGDKEPRNNLPAVRAESNFEEYPLFNFATRNRGADSYEFEKKTEGRDGLGHRKLWRVMPSAELGAPGSTDQDVYLAVLELLERKGGMPENGQLDFTLYELLSILGWSDAGNNYKLLRNCLRRVSVTSIESAQAFYSKDTESFLTDTFKLWTYHSETTRASGKASNRAGEGERERHTIRFDPIFINSWHAFYLKGIDSEFYWRLKSGVAKRLYRLVDKMRGDSLTWRQELFELRDQIPLAKYRYPSKVKEKLAPAHNELLDKGFLESVEFIGNEVRYRVSVEFAQHSHALELSGTPDELIAIERLLSEGVRGDVARDLVAKYGAEKCLGYSEALQFQEGIRNRPGWLRRAIENGYEVQLPAPENPGPTSVSAEGDSQVSLFESEWRGQPAPAYTPEADPEASRMWDAVLEEAAEEINAPSLRVWFEGTIPVSLSSESLTISVPNNFAKDYIEERFKEMLESALANHLSPTAHLKVVIEAGEDTHNTVRKGREA